jgi:glycosyltransferase involved in cell wall biosynthesis
MLSSLSMDVTIFIRTKNEARRLPECLARIRDQDSSLSSETIVLDSGSHDDTIRIATEFGARVYSIPSRLFDFSRALNFGVMVARGRYFVPLSGHAVPVDTAWLRELIHPFLADPNVTASYSRQVPWPEESAPTRQGIERGFPDGDAVLSKLLFEERCRRGEPPFEISKFSNVSACINTVDLRAHLFRSLPAAEDRCFAMEALLRGRHIAYASRSLVQHSHAPDFFGHMEIARINTIARRTIDAAGCAALALPAPRLTLLQNALTAVKPFAGVAWIALSALASADYRRYVLGEVGTACGKFRASISPTFPLPPPALPYSLETEAAVISKGP